MGCKTRLSLFLNAHSGKTNNMPSNATRIDALFPVPSPPPSPLSPARFPGGSHESSLALCRTLIENHTRHHVFFNDKGFHNHISHHLLAIYQLGASGPLLEAAYEVHAPSQRPAFKSPEAITKDNFHEHLGDEKFYNAYLEFFSTLLLDKGAAAIIEEYIFSPKANVLAPAVGQPPLGMLDRFLSGLLHPLIHVGYGAEFGLLGMVAEGLAQTAVHPPEAPVLVPPSLFSYIAEASSDLANASVSRLTALLPSLVLDNAQRVLSARGFKQDKSKIHALTIVAQILHNRDFEPSAIGLPPSDDGDATAFELVLEKRGERIVKLAQAWTVDGTNADEVASKIEELIWMNVVLYGAAGWVGRKEVENGEFNADFLLLHLVTSSLFLHSLTAYLSPTSTSILLRTYLANCLAWWVARGRPPLPIQDIYASVSAHPIERGAPHTQPGKDTLTASDPSPNPWLPIMQTTLGHPDDHLCKLQRALAHFAALYGTTPAGHFAPLADVNGAPLEGAEVLDGTLFLRVAGLSANRLGWMREGEGNKGWDFKGFL